MVTSTQFSEALHALDQGDIPSLERLLVLDPDLVRARWSGSEPPYDAYFRGATLLHHTVGNPSRCDLPSNCVDVARLLLDYGADVDAATENGDWSWTTLGLAASSGELTPKNLDLSMIDLLLDYGADPDWGGGVPLFGALFHVMEEPRLIRSARYLALRGASLDLAFAAGVGSIDSVRRFLDWPTLPADAYRLYRMASDRRENPDEQFVLDEALAFASLCGQTECARLLIGRGSDPSSFASMGRLRATPMHWAAYVGWTDVIALLLSKGARTDLQDPVYHSTPLGWAQHAGKAAVVSMLS